MYRQPVRGMIRPKISTMPRPKTEASAFLDLYKLTVEKKRLQQELNLMDARRQSLQERVAVIEAEVTVVEKNIQQMRQCGNTNCAANSASITPSVPTSVKASRNNTFDMQFVEY
jgi:hypothetical protein